MNLAVTQPITKTLGNTARLVLAAVLALSVSTACKPRLTGKNAPGQSTVAGAPGAEAGNPNRVNLIRGLSMVTNGAIQAGGGNPESFGMGDQKKNFDAGLWDQNFKTLGPDGLFDVQSTENRKDFVTWQWPHEGKTLKGTYVVDRRTIGDKRFLLMRLCSLDVPGASSPELFPFCGIAALDSEGQIGQSWTLCSGFTATTDLCKK